MEPIFEVVIPVVNLDLLADLLKSIYKNTILPKRVILIDNSKQPYSEIFKCIPNNGVVFEVYYSQTGFVNESINLGITKLSKNSQYVSILNDDVILGKGFFEKNFNLFEKEQSCAVACPHTVHCIEDIVERNSKYTIMRRREGWAPTIRKSVLEKIPLCPAERIAIFHWDDWIWHYTLEQRVYWYKDEGNIIYHAVGSSVDKLGFKRDPVHGKKAEKNEFKKIVAEKGWTKGWIRGQMR